MGSQEPSTTVVQPPPPQITPSPVQAPSAGETAAEVAQAKLQYDPQLAAQQFQLYQQYAPQTAQVQADIYRQQALPQAQAEFDIQKQIAPLQRALYEQLFPSQTQGLETLAQQSLQRLQSPESLTPDQLAAQQVSRDRAQERYLQGVRGSANLGGNLYSGARERIEREGSAELARQFVDQDLQRQQANRAQTLQELITAQQVLFPQIQQPGVAQGFTPQYQSSAPSPDALMNAILQANSQFIATPAQVGFGPSQFANNMSLVNAGIGAAASAAPFLACNVAEELYGKDDVRTHLARHYALTHNSPFLRAYRAFSDIWAKIIRRFPILKKLVKPHWDSMWRKQLTEFQEGK